MTLDSWLRAIERPESLASRLGVPLPVLLAWARGVVDPPEWVRRVVANLTDGLVSRGDWGRDA